MTRKTREEKKLAEYRRRLRIHELNRKPDNSVLQSGNSSRLEEKQEHKNTLNPKEKAQRDYFTRELKKSLLFILLIITLEFVIYFARMNRYF